MTIRIQQSHIKLSAIVLLAVTLINAFFLNILLIGIFSLISTLILSSILFGEFFLRNNSKYEKYFIGFLVFISLTAILGSIYYYLFPITKIGLISILTITIAPLLFKFKNSIDFTFKINKKLLLQFSIFLLPIFTWFIFISQISITEAIRSPWLIISPILLLLPAASIILTKKLRPIHIGILLFSILGLAGTVYTLGYGFDPFIHRATVLHIFENGTITPKPLYYIGQYAIELMLMHVFTFPILQMDVWLVPLLSSIILPMSFWIGSKEIFNKNYAGLLALLLIPLSAFIVTTPQSLAYIFTLSLIFLSLRIPLTPLFILTLAALFTHPIAGIPAAIYFSIIFVFKKIKQKKIRTFLLVTGSIASSILMPLIFILQAKISNLDIKFNPVNLFSFSNFNPQFFVENRFSPLMDGAYLFITNQILLLIFLTLIGAFLLYKQNSKPIVFLPLLSAGIFLVNYWILGSAFEFSFLTLHERANYTDRLLLLSIFSLTPYIGVFIERATKKIEQKQHLLLTYSWKGLIMALIIANFYGAYPRHDNYARSSGFNMSKSDIEATAAIEKNSNEDFIVLANQMTSAAAVQEFGFKQYYKNDIFYYPIPTGGALYEQYIQMANDYPSRQSIEIAMDLTGVNLGYFVLNDYWWNAEQTAERAKQEANEWFRVSDSITVFVFSR